MDICGRLQEQRQPLGAGARPIGIDGVVDRPNFNRAILCGGNAAGQFQCVVEVFGFEHVIATGDLRGLGEWAVGNRRRVRAT